MFNRDESLLSDRNELLRVIRQVRNRWRLRVALRGLAIVIGAGIAAFAVSLFGLEYFRFTPAAVISFRALTYLTLAGLIVHYLVRPLSRRVSDERVALYLEEHEPSLDASVLSALEHQDRVESLDHSPALVRRLVEVAMEKCRGIDFGRTVEAESLKQSSGALAIVGIATTLLFVFGPSYLRYGVSALLFPTGSVEAASPYRIEVLPGDATIARGSDQTVTARLIGFDSEQVELFRRVSTDAPFEPVPLLPTVDGDAYEVMLFDLEAATTYFVQSTGVRSAVFTLDVVDLPYVDRIELEYRFPAYTGLPTQTIEDGGDIAALKGTEIRFRVTSTMGTPRGLIVLDHGDPILLTPGADGLLAGSLTVSSEGFYRIDLEGPSGEMITASPQFTIDVLDDQPPAVSFVKPGRDSTASPVEEVFLEARADDDFGVRSLDVVYSVNGTDEQTIHLYGGRDGGRKSVSAGHTFFLEELELEPGDFVSYYARASDNSERGKPVTSDLYFVQIRPFRKDFRAAESQAGMGGGGGGGGDTRGLSEQQRQIISATFNVIRDRDQATAEQYRENVVFLALSQGKLREQVQTLVDRLNSRVVQADEAFQAIAALLPQALSAMEEAEGKLQAQAAQDALTPEQRALQFLQRAEEVYEDVRVTMGQQGGGGGGGGGANTAAEELADLFELELDKLQNQYETMQRGQQEAMDNQVDEALERLRELARRQEQEAERQRRRASGQQSAPGGGASQRALAEEAEEAARQLERLAREEPTPQRQEAARRLREAADAMRRAAATGGNQGLADATAALERLREARAGLQQDQEGRLERDIQDAMDRADRLAEQQQELAGDVSELGAAEARDQDRVRQLLERKDEMSAEVGDLERSLDTTAGDFNREQQDASRKLREAADSIRKNKLKEKILYSKNLLVGRSGEYADTFEQQIGSDIDTLRERLREAAAAVGRNEQTARNDALERARDLMRGVESLDDRMRAGRDGQPGQDGQQGQGGQQGQEGQQGQAGEEGQGGQGGQGGQAGAGRRADGQPGDQPGGGDRVGAPGGGGGYGQRRPGAFSTDEVRQFRREYQEREVDARELRQQLTAEGLNVEDLDAIIRAMRELDDQRVYADGAELERLQSFVLEGLKRFEYQLRRQLTEEDGQLFLSGSDDVPAGFREYIEEYYRALSKGQP